MSAADRPDGELIFPLQDQHVHSSSIVQCPNGDLLVCWYHGSGERSANDVRVEGARQRKGESTWSPIFLMADVPGMPDCNPVLHVDAQQRLWLFWAQVVGNRWEHCLTRYRRAAEFQADGAPKWDWQDVISLLPGDDFPEHIREGFKAIGFEQGAWGEYALPYDEMIVEAARDPYKRQKGWMPRNHVAELPSGRMLLPLYSDGFNLSLVAISDDAGETWRASQPIVGVGPIQPSIVRRKNGELVAYFRDGGGGPGRVQISTSDDEGETWTAAVDTDILNPSGSMEVIRLTSGNWVMVNNDVEEDRRQLAVTLSTDEGTTWGPAKYLDRDEQNSYGYPSMIQTADGRIHVTYTYTIRGKGETIKHVVFDEDWLPKAN
ncbi:MAG: sialidase family protein [Pirellulales bacterium]